MSWHGNGNKPAVQYVTMMKNMMMIICAFVISMTDMNAQTPAEELIDRYSSVQGSRDFIASGPQMILARSLIRMTPLASIAPDVDVLEVLKMQNASDSNIEMFEKDLKSVLSSYEYYGKAMGKNGMVDIYVSPGSSPDVIKELVIYNPEIHTLNSLKGTFSASELVSIEKSLPQ